MLLLDHVIYAVRDLEEASARFREEFGLPVTDGGVHPGGGTKNAAVPCRDFSYVELLAAIDPSDPGVNWLTSLVSDGDRLCAWAVKTDDIEREADRLGLLVAEGSIEMPDGRTGSWKTAESDPWDPSLPFFIQYASERGTRAVDAGAPERMSWIEVSGDEARLREWLGGASLPVRVVTGAPGVRAVALATPAGEVVIR